MPSHNVHDVVIDTLVLLHRLLNLNGIWIRRANALPLQPIGNFACMHAALAFLVGNQGRRARQFDRQVDSLHTKSGP